MFGRLGGTNDLVDREISIDIKNVQNWDQIRSVEINRFVKSNSGKKKASARKDYTV